MPEHITETLVRLQSQVDWWVEQAEQIHRDRKNLPYILPAGLVVGMIGSWFSSLIGACLFALTIVIWGMGLYMVTVRRSEFKESLREAKDDLREAQQIADSQTDTVRQS